MSRPLSRARYAEDENLERVVRAIVTWRRVQDKHFDAEQRALHFYPEEKRLYNAVARWMRAVSHD